MMTQQEWERFTAAERRITQLERAMADLGDALRDVVVRLHKDPVVSPIPQLASMADTLQSFKRSWSST